MPRLRAHSVDTVRFSGAQCYRSKQKNEERVNFQVTPKYVEQSHDLRQTPVHKFLVSGDMVKLHLIANHIVSNNLLRPNYDFGYRNTILHVLAATGQADVLESLLQQPGYRYLLDRPNLVCQELESGGSVRSNGDTPLGVALFFRQARCASILLKYGASVDKINASNNSILHLAAAIAIQRPALMVAICEKLLGQGKLKRFIHHHSNPNRPSSVLHKLLRIDDFAQGGDKATAIQVVLKYGGRIPKSLPISLAVHPRNASGIEAFLRHDVLLNNKKKVLLENKLTQLILSNEYVIDVVNGAYNQLLCGHIYPILEHLPVATLEVLSGIMSQDDDLQRFHLQYLAQEHATERKTDWLKSLLGDKTMPSTVVKLTILRKVGDLLTRPYKYLPKDWLAQRDGFPVDRIVLERGDTEAVIKNILASFDRVGNDSDLFVIGANGRRKSNSRQRRLQVPMAGRMPPQGVQGITPFDQSAEDGGAQQLFATGVWRVLPKSQFAKNAYLKDIPLIGSASGGVLRMLAVGHALLAEESLERKNIFSVGAIGAMNCFGYHSFHEGAVLAQRFGLPYQDGNYRSGLPPLLAEDPRIQALLSDFETDYFDRIHIANDF